MEKRDLTNQIFNGIKGIKLSHKDKGGRSYWIFRCHCAKHFIAQGYKVTSGHTRSCGCLFSIRDKNYPEKLRKKIKSNIEITESGCWNWKGSINTNGYAQIVGYGQRSGPRLSYKVFKGDFDESFCVCHNCDNKKCVNPDHLFLGTHKDNHFDMIVKGRQNYAIGIKASKTKLTEEQVREARALYNSGKFGCSILSKKYKVTSRTIWCAIKGKTWKHI